MEKKFNIGDKVRVVPEYTPQQKDGATGVVAGVAGNGWVRVRSDGCLRVDAFVDGKCLELIESYNHKTAFLSELKELLSKYDAKINCRCPDDDSMCDYPCVCIGDDTLFYISDTGITADNIMDYEKE